MYLPELSNIAQSRATINTFGGVNKKEDCQGNEFINMMNMSSDSYPCIAPRKKRYESDFNWYSIHNISEVEDLKTDLYLSCFDVDSSNNMTVVCYTKVINDICMDNNTIQFVITNYRKKYIKLGDNYYLINKMDLTAANYGDSTGIVVIQFDNKDAVSYFENNPLKNIYNLYIKDNNGNYLLIPYIDEAGMQTSATRVAYVNNCFYWLKDGCINYSLYLSNIKAVCTFHDPRSGISRLKIDIVYSDKIKNLFDACENAGEKLKFTVDGNRIVECIDVLEGEIVFLFQYLFMGHEYTLSIETNNQISNAVIGTLTEECDGDTDLIVGGNKIISIPSMYTYDTKYLTEERMSDKAEFCLDNGNSNNIRIMRIVEDDGAVTWRFTVNTEKSANFWKRTIVDKETGKTIKKGYELNEYIYGPFIFFYTSNGVEPLPYKYHYWDAGRFEKPANINITDIAANKITFEMHLGIFDYISVLPEKPMDYVDEFDYKLRHYFTQASYLDTEVEGTEIIGSNEQTETTVRTVYNTLLGYDPSFDSIIGYVANGEMDELPFNIKFACASDNRLFACNQEGDRVFISAIGRIHDFVNEENGTMSADDIGVLSEGNFTGIVSFNHNVYFFKEKCVHKLYGTYSEDWQLVEYHINGVQEGAENSIVTYDNYIIYKGTDAFYMYDGSYTKNISEKLGSTLDMSSFECCFAAGFKEKYYAFCKTTKNDETVYTMYVYDIGKGLWHIEENNSDKEFISMYSTAKGIVALEAEKNGDIDFIKTISIAGCVLDKNREENDFLWSATTGDLLTDLSDNKYFTKLQLRLWVDKNSKLGIDIKYDNDEWEKVGDDITATDKASVVFPIIPRRCDHLALRFYGKGNAKIFSITETIEEASEI